MIRLREGTALTALFLCFATVVLVMSADLGGIARRTPLAVAVPTLALLLYQFCRDLLPAGTADDRAGETAPAGGEREVSRREWRIIAGFAVLLAAIHLFGLSVALTIYVLYYMSVETGEGWRFSMSAAAVVWVVLHGVFDSLMKLNLYDGMLLGWVIETLRRGGA